MNARTATAIAGTMFLAVVALPAGLALAQVTTAPTPAVRTSGIPQRDTLLRMSRPVSIELKDTRF